MYLKISSSDGIIYDGEIKEFYVNTETGYIGILPGHMPLMTVVVPGIAKIVNTEIKEIVLSKGILFTDGKKILVTVSEVPKQNDIEILNNIKENLKKELEELKLKGEIENIEKVLTQLQTIEAQIKLLQKKGFL